MSPQAKMHLNFLASMPLGHTMIERSDLREMLSQTGGTMFAHGRLYDIVAKDVGADFYKVSLTPTYP